MGNRSVNRDLKIAALNLYEQGHLPLKTILSCVGFSRSTFFRMVKLWRTTGDVVHQSNRTGRPRLLCHDDIDYLVLLIQERPDWFLDELLNLLKHNCFISVHYTTIAGSSSAQEYLQKYYRISLRNGANLLGMTTFVKNLSTPRII